MKRQFRKNWQSGVKEDGSTLLCHGKIRRLHNLREQLYHLIPDVSGVLTPPEWLRRTNLTTGHHLCEMQVIKSFQKTLCPTKQENKTNPFLVS